jgi:hypothetical protein
VDYGNWHTMFAFEAESFQLNFYNTKELSEIFSFSKPLIFAHEFKDEDLDQITFYFEGEIPFTLYKISVSFHFQTYTMKNHYIQQQNENCLLGYYLTSGAEKHISTQLELEVVDFLKTKSAERLRFLFFAK